MTGYENTPLSRPLPWLPYGKGRFPRNLPCTSAVYFALTADNAILYIGQTGNLRQRWATHHRRHQLHQEGGVRFAWQDCLSPHLNDLKTACWFRYHPTVGHRKGAPTMHILRLARVLPDTITLQSKSYVTD